jgi:hypothetical protein
MLFSGHHHQTGYDTPNMSRFRSVCQVCRHKKNKPAQTRDASKRQDRQALLLNCGLLSSKVTSHPEKTCVIGMNFTVHIFCLNMNFNMHRGVYMYGVKKNLEIRGNARALN